MIALRYFIGSLMAVPGPPGVFFLAQGELLFVGFSEWAAFVVEQKERG
jgi:hypothetical protein